MSKRHSVVLSNPAKTKTIASAKLKKNKVGESMLATLPKGGYIAESYVPSRQIMSLRELARYRANLARMRGSLKNSVDNSILVNSIRSDYSTFIKGFSEEPVKVEDGRVQVCLRIIEKLNLEIYEAS